MNSHIFHVTTFKHVCLIFIGSMSSAMGTLLNIKLGSGDVSRTVLAWLGGSLEALTGSCDGVSLPLSLLLSSAKLNRAGGLDRSVGDRVLVLGEEEGGPVEGIPGGRLGAWDRSLGMVLARKPPSSSDSSPQAFLGDLTPRDWTRLLNDS